VTSKQQKALQRVVRASEGMAAAQERGRRIVADAAARRAQAIRAAQATGLTLETIARELGVKRQRVHQLLRG
jgi:DNA-directed RNA polymerase specialized sigma24 family protein